ncbi:hypothetical protein HUW51_19425 [Adhaeribacter swui]|uniref:ArnR1-like winged helix-turn-helix domain-containing protein n=1 Tax=Adhaeribacter swui TaxID=2086471 RepID=A0A7G7GCA7_9BACT|nr:hypothetical protein [Adhaeribacter swui]QNF34791.1 hypothetical protein HUW51_19425 [Adhaeribacter swui]
MEEKQGILALEDVKKEILEFCLLAHDREEILTHINLDCNPVNYTRYIGALLSNRYLKTNLLDKRRSRQEKYLVTQKGLNYLKAIAY